MVQPIVRSGLYAIADADACQRAGTDLAATAFALLEARPAALQLRWKDAAAGELLALTRRILEAARGLDVPVIVDDRVDVARMAGADGVHLGQDDLPLSVARAQLPAGSLIGISTHDLAQVRAATEAGADYLGFGPIFPTGSKERPDPVVGLPGLEAATLLAGGTPVVAIGGITHQTLPGVRQSGARAAALIGELLREGTAPELVRAQAEALDRHFREGGE